MSVTINRTRTIFIKINLAMTWRLKKTNNQGKRVLNKRVIFASSSLLLPHPTIWIANPYRHDLICDIVAPAYSSLKPEYGYHLFILYHIPSTFIYVISSYLSPSILTEIHHAQTVYFLSFLFIACCCHTQPYWLPLITGVGTRKEHQLILNGFEYIFNSI